MIKADINEIVASTFGISSNTEVQHLGDGSTTVKMPHGLIAVLTPVNGKMDAQLVYSFRRASWFQMTSESWFQMTLDPNVLSDFSGWFAVIKAALDSIPDPDIAMMSALTAAERKTDEISHT